MEESLKRGVPVWSEGCRDAAGFSGQWHRGREKARP